MDVQARVVNYFKNNTFIQKYLKGIDSKTSEVVFNYNGESRRMTIDDLENKIKNENDLISFFEGRLINPSVKNEQNNEVRTSVTNNPTYKQEEIIEETIEPSLYDIVVLTELKNKEGMDNLLKKYAVNESTGLIDFNLAVKKVTSNTIKEVEKSIINNNGFSSDLTKFDIEGNYVGELLVDNSTVDEKIMRGFQNINAYLVASKMYPEQANFNSDNIEKFKEKYINKVKTDLNINDRVVNKEPIPKKIMTLEKKEVKNAGFADVFVLTVIVLVYAVIIVNLILKLK